MKSFFIVWCSLLIHYHKIAFRNLWKYKNQTLISTAGLAVGFTCFTLSVSWIRYEMTYDGFHKNAERMYYINISDERSVNGISNYTSKNLASYLKATFPEIRHTATIGKTKPGMTIEYDDVETPADFISVDSSFFSMFDIKIIEGNRDFFIFNSKNIAITKEKSLKLFGNENPLGKIITSPQLQGKYTICAIVTGISKHSNYTFDFMLNETYNGHTIIELIKDIDIDALKNKLYEHTIQEGNSVIQKMTIAPLTAMHYKDPNIPREVKFQHIVIFAISGLLLILCTLFNYLILFISRLKLRERELALRRVYGSSIKLLFALLLVEFGLVVLSAFLLSAFLIYIVFPFFQTLSNAQMELYSIYFEYFIYIIGVIFASVLIFLIIFRQRQLNVAIRKRNNRFFRRTLAITQIIISIGFIFCTAIILKQMYHLQNNDLGFAYENRGSISTGPNDIDVFHNQIRQIPEITETVIGATPLLPLQFRKKQNISDWEEKPSFAENVHINEAYISEQYTAFYEFELLDGEMLSDKDDEKYVLINESAAKAFGWHKPVGKSFDKYIIKGVVKDIYNFAPTVSAEPFYYVHSEHKNGTILFKYNEGTWRICKDKIGQILKKEYPEVSNSMIFRIISNTEEEYGKLLKSENILLKILTFVSLVCVVISIFGFVSMVLLTCEERRKEIAIRKVNGATIKDILDIFFKEYFLLLLVGAVMAFSTGYYIMKSWLEQYTRQTIINAWIYVLILLSLAFVIILCVGKKVYETSSENPAEVLKKE
ncbi:MAG: ABC transporter permease [Bacteroidales bacterium]|nr:ABC transporter permease [Bacteroidales bacterium]